MRCGLNYSFFDEFGFNHFLFDEIRSVMQIKMVYWMALHRGASLTLLSVKQLLSSVENLEN